MSIQCPFSGISDHSHLSLVVADESRAVGLDDGGQSGSIEVATGHPAGELVVPDTVVATEEHAVGLGEVGDLVAATEGELAARRLGCILYRMVGNMASRAYKL